jgi:hypothetical protein
MSIFSSEDFTTEDTRKTKQFTQRRKGPKRKSSHRFSQITRIRKQKAESRKQEAGRRQ